MVKSILITGANAGLGKETARQLALNNGVEKIYLGCRNEEKAKTAKQDLEDSTGKSIFEIILMDVSNLKSVRAAVNALNGPIEALVMNAGGAGGKNFHDLTEDKTTQIFATNVLGHAVLAEELIKAKKLTKVAIYAGSEAVRGVKEMGIKPVKLNTSSVEEFVSVCDGSFFGTVTDSMIPYGPVKYIAALWMSAMARKYPDIRFVTMSPGATTGTEVLNVLPFFKKLMFSVMFKVMLLRGKVHKLEVGARRFVDGLTDDSYKSGVFYASRKGVTGPVVDQGTIFKDLHNQSIQDNAYEAVHQFVR